MAQRNIIIFLIICGLVGGVLGYQTKTANAAAIIGDPWQFLKEFVIKPLVRTIANSLENKIVNSLNKQISNIDGRSPSFITNWRNHMLDSQARGNDVFRSVLADTKLCGYFDKNLKTAFGADKFAGAIGGAKVKDSLGNVVYENKTNIPGLPSFQSLANCTLPSSFDVKEFNKDFSKGGWQTWNKLIQPQNNFFGIYSLALNEQQRQMATEEQATMDSAVAGQGFLSQKLGKVTGMEGVATAGVGPTGCADVQVGNKFSTVTVNRCTFMGKEVTPAQVLGKTAASAIDTKLKRPGAASEITDILLGLFAAIVQGTTNRLANYIGQATYNQPPPAPAPVPFSSGYNEQQFQPGAGDPNFDNQTNQMTQNCKTNCMNSKETACRNSCPADDNATPIGCYSDCMSPAEDDCNAQCSSVTP